MFKEAFEMLVTNFRKPPSPLVFYIFKLHFSGKLILIYALAI